MKLSLRLLAALAAGLLLVAGCGGGDQSPHTVAQPDVSAEQTGSPGQNVQLDRAVGEQLTPEQAAEEQEAEAARAGASASTARRPAYFEWTIQQASVNALTIGPPAVPALIDLLGAPQAIPHRGGDCPAHHRTRDARTTRRRS